VHARQSWSIPYFVIGKYLYTHYIHISGLLSKGFEFINLQVFSFTEKNGTSTLDFALAKGIHTSSISTEWTILIKTLKILFISINFESFQLFVYILTIATHIVSLEQEYP
jgi:hypothetical protein